MGSLSPTASAHRAGGMGRSGDCGAPQRELSGALHRGVPVTVRLEVLSRNPIRYVVVRCPIPAGFEVATARGELLSCAHPTFTLQTVSAYGTSESQAPQPWQRPPAVRRSPAAARSLSFMSASGLPVPT